MQNGKTNFVYIIFRKDAALPSVGMRQDIVPRQDMNSNVKIPLRKKA